MARANRHYIPGYIWHITHRCHRREFLLKFLKDRARWLQWLVEARKRYGLVVLNYTVTSNHIHLLVLDKAGEKVIPSSMQLVAGRTAQEYNARKKRLGAYWQDRYHATAIENGKHFRRCLVYIDLNMLRAGVVSHPREWVFCGYNEIQHPRRKNKIIAYEQLMQLLGFDRYDQMTAAYRGWIEDAIEQGAGDRQPQWSESIAVGNKKFIEGTIKKLGSRAAGRRVVQSEGQFELKDPEISYNAHFGPKKANIDHQNGYYWNVSQ
ncbi:MAG: transposase [Deltaproteobacteria bacterium]|jgi:putative transposase|nr:transposase [Deltaproteobacteria bacterium]